MTTVGQVTFTKLVNAGFRNAFAKDFLREEATNSFADAGITIEVDEDLVIVFTSTIKVTESNLEFDIGYFAVKVDFAGSIIAVDKLLFDMMHDIVNK